MTPGIEYLTSERIIELRDELVPLFGQACEGHEIVQGNLTAEEVLATALAGYAVVFLGTEDGRPSCVLAIQFFQEGKVKGADVLAMAGSGLLRFKRHYWGVILDWLRANGVQCLDAYVDLDRVEVYKRKFGFTRACALVRMDLGAQDE